MVGLLLLSGAAAFTFVVPAQERNANQTDQVGPWQKQILAELRQLRLELNEHRLQYQEERLSELKLELQRIEDERGRMHSDTSAERRISDINEQLASPTLGSTEREQLEVLKADVAHSTQERLATEQADISKRERDVRSRLQAYQQRLNALKQTAADLVTPNNNPGAPQVTQTCH